MESRDSTWTLDVLSYRLQRDITRQASEGQETGKQTGRQGLDNRRVERQARGSATGGQTGRRGAGNREADRPAGTRQWAGGQTGEGSETGRISVVETVQELWESSVSTRDDLAETEWSERIYIEGSQVMVMVVGLIRGE